MFSDLIDDGSWHVYCINKDDKIFIYCAMHPLKINCKSGKKTSFEKIIKLKVHVFFFLHSYEQNCQYS